MIVDFTNIPDETPVSAGNFYDGILYLEAMLGTCWSTAFVSGGALAAQPIETSMPDPRYQSHLMGVFLRPVTDVTLLAKCYRNAHCSYQGVDSQGVGFTQGTVITGSLDGGAPSTGWVTVQLTIPAGGHLVSFQIGNSDPKNLDAAFWLKSISFSAQLLPPSNLHVVGCKKA